MAPNNDRICRHVALAGLVLVGLAQAMADERHSPVSLSADSYSELRRQLRGRSYMLMRSENDAEFRLWVFDEGGLDEQLTGAISPIDEDDTNDLLEWNRAAVALLDADGSTRVDALYALADIDSRAASSLIQGALKDPDPRVRITAIELLGETGETGVLVESWWQLPSAEQIHVIDALGDVESPQSTAFLNVVANSDNAELAEIAGQYLEERE